MSIRQDLVQYYRWLRQYGNNDSHSGNASARDGDVIWVTPSGASADMLEGKDLVPCRLDGTQANGASLDAALHIEIYKRNPTTHAVLHSHGAYSVAMTLGGKDFEPADFEGRLYFPSVPVITIASEDYLEQSPRLVAETLSEHRIMIIRGHGVYACAESLDLAYKWTCSLELSAKTAYLAKQAGTL